MAVNIISRIYVTVVFYYSIIIFLKFIVQNQWNRCKQTVLANKDSKEGSGRVTLTSLVHNTSFTTCYDYTFDVKRGLSTICVYQYNTKQFVQ